MKQPKETPTVNRTQSHGLNTSPKQLVLSDSTADSTKKRKEFPQLVNKTSKGTDLKEKSSTFPIERERYWEISCQTENYHLLQFAQRQGTKGRNLVAF